MKKRHTGSVDPTKLVVGIGILAVIAVGAGLLSSGIGSFQGDTISFQGAMAQRNIPRLLLRLSGSSPEGTVISDNGSPHDNVAVGKWLLIPNPPQERFTVRAIGFDLDHKNRNQLIPRIFRGAKIMRGVNLRENIQVMSTALSDTHFDGNCEMVPVEPFEVTGAKMELRLMIDSIEP